MVGKAAVLHDSKCKYFGFKANRLKILEKGDEEALIRV